MSILQRIKDKMGEGDLKSTLVQFIKFGIVGVSNTAISYAIKNLFHYVILVNSPMSESAKIFLGNAVAFVISVTNSYYWNNRFVFKSGERKDWRAHAKAYLKTVLCYGVTGLLLSPAIEALLMNHCLSSEYYYVASLASLVVTIPLNFLLNKFWAFNDGPSRKNVEE